MLYLFSTNIIPWPIQNSCHGNGNLATISNWQRRDVDPEYDENEVEYHLYPNDEGDSLWLLNREQPIESLLEFGGEFEYRTEYDCPTAYGYEISADTHELVEVNTSY